MFAGFKEFISRGNVIDLAVAVIIGAAFSGVVNAVVEQVLNPAIGALFNAKNLNDSLNVVIPTLTGGAATLRFGAIVAALIQFIIVAAFVYFAVVVPINRLKKATFEKRDEADDAKESAPTELELLGQIRDLLARGVGEPGGGKHHQEP